MGALSQRASDPCCSALLPLPELSVITSDVGSLVCFTLFLFALAVFFGNLTFVY